jgi:hypothetical protein
MRSCPENGAFVMLVNEETKAPVQSKLLTKYYKYAFTGSVAIAIKPLPL